ncbi:type I polyketide synthase, partial [Streptomyces sp. 150FB]|uniref:type I polyketide synthase n=1 Tax=Streptomyces sp. 150FB TaxID=1576605 RepID=UPI001364CBAB
MQQESAPASAGAATGQAVELRLRLAGVSEDEQHRILLTLVRAQVATATGKPGPFPENLAFRRIGVYQDRGTRLRDLLAAATGVRVPATLLFDYPTCGAVVRFLSEALLGDPSTVTAVDVAAGDPAAPGDDDPIAIVGMGCHYAGGVHSPEDLWRLVMNGEETTSGYPTDRGWDVENLYDPDPDKVGTCCTRYGSFLHDAADFDPGLFGISPREALGMDPQQRLLLEVAWEALESAGIDPLNVTGRPGGVFVGVPYTHYGPALHKPAKDMHGYLLTGSLTSVASGRVSYVFGLEGPALTVDTACSSSLVALHLAVQALRRGECAFALAGGVTVMSTPGVLQEFSRKRGLSPDGRCKAFSDDADGTGWGEGAGMLVLERLSDAERDGHRVLAVVRGSAVNQDGASNGLTAPNGPSQQRVIRAALADAGLSATDVDAVEAHGTGTALGDPIEAQALLATYGQQRDAERPLLLGSLKSNIGHTQAASGVGGVIKMVLAMRHGVLPKTLHVSEPSRHVDWSSGAVELLTEPRDWPGTDRPRRSAVSSFGVSGTNAHVVLEQAPEQPAPAEAADPEVVPLVVSGRGTAGVRAQAERLASFVRAGAGAVDTDARVGDVAWSLVGARGLFADRAVVVGSGREGLATGLDALASGDIAPNVVTGTADVEGRTAFVFPGQGWQWAGMAADLLESAPVFAERMAECERALGVHVEWSLAAVLRGEGGAPSLARVDVVQPVSWAVMVSLAALWRSYGVEPDAVVGHSQGEIAAACVSGLLSLEDAALVVALRSRALVALSGLGGMVSVALPVDEVAERLAAWEGLLSVAAVNGPSSVVVSGDADAIDGLFAELSEEGARVRRIEVDYASHSSHVEAIRDELLEVLGSVRPGVPSVEFRSSVGGDLAAVEVGGAAYWYENLRRTVEFEPAVRELAGDGFTAFVECSAHPVLAMGVQGVLDAAVEAPTVVVGSLRRGEGGTGRFLVSLAEAFVRGVPVDWRRALGEGRQLVDLPTYAFQRSRYWLDAPLLGPTPAGTGESVDDGFWRAVRQEDVKGLAGQLAVTTESLAELMPALRSWDERRGALGQVDSWRYRVSWSALKEPAGSPVRVGAWLLAAAEDDTSAPAVAEALRRSGATVRTLAVDPAGLARDTLLELLGEQGAFDAVLSLFALDERRDPEHPAVPAGLAANLALLQALQDPEAAAPLWCVTSGAVAVDDHDPLTHPFQAETWGLGRVAALEYPRAWGGLVDLPADSDAAVYDRLCAVLARGDGEDQVAVRRTGVFGRRLVRARAGEAPVGEAAPGRAWRPRGTVLITGGTGALGGHVARWLAARGAERLVLTSRRGEEAPGAGELVAELAALGARATVVACDLGDRAAVERLVRDHEVRGEAIRNVMHTAGVAPLAPLADLTVDELSTVASGKVAGAENLLDLLDHATLDTVVLFSSIAAVWGVGDHGAYAAANAYLDALAHRARAHGTAVHSVAWGPWAGGGMIADTLEDTLRRRGVPLIQPDLSIQALQQILDRDETAVAVADVDWERFAAVFSSTRPSPLVSELPEVRAALAESADTEAPGSGGGNVLAAELAALSEQDRDRTLLDLVRSHAARVLGHTTAEAVDARRAFMELGFDSLSAVELRNGLSTATGCRLPATAVFDYPTPRDLARFLRETLLGDTAEAPGAVPAALPAPGDDDPIAIVGMGCRYPGGVTSPEELWRLVMDEADVVSPFPTDRGWDLADLYDADPDRAGTSYVRAGGFLHDAADFEPEFFGISPREALAMDPQQRLLLEVAHEAIERARITPASLKGSQTGVFVGLADQAYATSRQGGADGFEGYFVTGGASSVASGRISYVLGLEGPAVTVDTACSSSLVALHLAVQALRRGECTLALAGASMVMSTPAQFIGFSRQRGLSADGRCKAFSDD